MIQGNLNKYELLANLQNEISKIIDDDKALTKNLVIVAHCNEYASKQGTYYYENAGLDYVTTDYDNEYTDYALVTVVSTDTLYLICIGTD